MITDKQSLKNILQLEKKQYSDYMFPSRARYIISYFKREPARMIWTFQCISRKADFYNMMRKKHHNRLFYKLAYFFCVCKKNRIGQRLGLEIITENIGKGLIIYHYNNIVNRRAIIGENCHLHGYNVIGNAGPNDLRCPCIGNNVMVGAGAKVIGNVTIADNIKIAAGAVVVHSFLEPGITIAGIPARKVSK